jgi:hypothetical protein
MTNGTFNTSKCKGKLQKMGVLYTHSPQSPSPFAKFSKKKSLKHKKIFAKKLGVPQPAPWLVTSGRPPAAAHALFFVHHDIFFQTPTPPP